MVTDYASRDELILNGLVDGELSPGEHAAAAARLAGDREFARAYATLTRLKACVAEIADEVPPLEVPLPAARSRRRTIVIGSAAAMAAAALLMVVAVLLRPADKPAGTADAPASGVMLAAFPGQPVIPDLTAAGLQLAGSAIERGAGTPVLVATYLGPRGCRLELRVRAADTDAVATAGTDRRAWRVGDLAYELVAYGMPAGRFAAVAEAAERATRATGLPEGIDRQLREARASAPPCLA